jgi:2-hydroxychromene-2-carboxylate isomerase
MKNIEFWFSIGSTYTYLSVTRILDVEKKHQVKFCWKPFSVRKIMKEMDNVPFPPNKKNKVDYMWRDIERRAKFYGFFANVPVPYPLTELDLANKIAILGLKEGWGIEYIRLTYKRWFQEGKEPAVEPNISEIFKLLKLDHKKTMNEANAEPINNIYEANTNLARQKKIFGSPTFIYEDENFWGDDRMEDSIKWAKN